MDLTNKSRMFLPPNSIRIHILKCTQNIPHMLGHKTHLNKFKIEIVSSIFSNHSCMKVEITGGKRN